MSTLKILLTFFALTIGAFSQTLTITAGNGQLAHLGTGLGGGPIVFHLVNGTQPVPNATILFSNPGQPNFIPLSASSVITNSAGTATVNFEPAYLGFQNDEVYKLVATSGPASLTFYETASQPPITVSFTTPGVSDTVLFPVKATAGQPASFHFVTSITGGLSNVSTQIVPVPTLTPAPPGTVLQTGYCLEGASEPEKAVYSVDGTATCTPVLNVPNSALSSVYNTLSFDVVVGGVFIFGPYYYSITATPLTASLVTTTVLEQLNTPFSIPITVAGGVPPYTFTVTGGQGALPVGVTIGSTGIISGTATTAGKYMPTIVVTDSAGASKTLGPLSLGISSGPFMVTPTALASATLGVAYSQTLQVTGGVGPYTWAVGASLPSGLLATLGDSTGDSLIISGTPKVAGTTAVSFIVTDSFGEKYVVPTIYTLAVTNPLTSSTTSFPIATVGKAYNTGITVAGGTAPFTYSSTALPAGLVLSSTTGTVTGTPTTAGSYPVTVTVTDSLGNTVTVAANIEVSNGPLSYPTAVTLPVATIGAPYSTQLPAPLGGVPPYTFAFAGTPPAGVTLSPTGLLTTTPTAAATESLSILITDGAAETITVPLTLTVISNLPTITALVNASSFLTSSPSPGELVSLFGTTLGPANGVNFSVTAAGTVSTTLAGVQVTFNGIPAPLLYVSSIQVNAVVPFGVVSGATVPVVVSYNGNTSNTFSQVVGTADPGVFRLTGTQGAVLNSDYSVNSAAAPAAIGQFIQIYGTGAGLFTPAVTDGQLPTTASTTNIANVVVTVGGIGAQVLYAGVAPGEVAGVFQINAIIPTGVTPGNSVPLVVNIGNESSQSETVTIAVN